MWVDPPAGEAIIRLMLRQLLRRRGRESVEITDEGVTRTLANGQVESVRWDGLTEVRILTTSEGPFVDDVFFVLAAGETGCVIPQSHADEGFVARLQRLPGFSNEKMVEAMGSTSDAEFICWRSPEPRPPEI